MQKSQIILINVNNLNFKISKYQNIKILKYRISYITNVDILNNYYTY